ncbi:MAG: hypothetical protein L0Z62_25175 [Gemmataceae bacterium]|nr:hypothetical protein [Gemmataceae bacterium]
MLDRLLSALAALSLALLVWLYVRSRDQEMLDHVPIPVQITLVPGQAEHYELEVTGPSQVPVSFTGPPSRIRELRGLLQRGEMRVEATLTVPEDRLQESRLLDTVHVEAGDLHPPPGVTPIVVQGRNQIPVVLHRLVERRLPVRAEQAPEEQPAQVAVEPTTVPVRGPQEVLDRTRALATQPIAVPPPAEATTGAETITFRAVPLVQELEGRPVRVTPATVRARLTLQPRQRLYELTDVAVRFLCPANFGLRPLFGDERAGKITLRLLGPATADPPTVAAFIDLSGERWKPGLYEEPLRLQLPKDFQLAQSPPRSVAFQLVPADAGRK